MHARKEEEEEEEEPLDRKGLQTLVTSNGLLGKNDVHFEQGMMVLQGG